jgi:uncharacterized glyoxalase superfamily protein PhnB
MLASSEVHGPSLLPLMRYRDVGAAISWLCDTFGFEKQLAVTDSDGSIFYAQLTYGNSMIMLGGMRDTDLDQMMCQPDEVGGAETQSCYLVVDDADAHHAQATAAGAEIVLDLKSDAYGRRGYSCRDPQGHIWNFGTYNPWRGVRPPAAVTEGTPHATSSAPKRAAAYALFTLLAIATGSAWWMGGAGWQAYTTLSLSPSTTGSLQRIGAPRSIAILQKELAAARASKNAAELSAETARRELADQRSARAASQSESRALRQKIRELEGSRKTVGTNVPKPHLVRSGPQDAAATNKIRTSVIERLKSEKEAAQQLIEKLKEELEQTRLPAKTARSTPSKTANTKPSAARDLPPQEKKRGTKAENANNTLVKKADRPHQQKIETSATMPAKKAINPNTILTDEERDAREDAKEDAKRYTTAAAPPEVEPKLTRKAEPVSNQKPAPKPQVQNVPKKSYTRRKRPPTYVLEMSNVPWPYSAWHPN